MKAAQSTGHLANLSTLSITFFGCKSALATNCDDSPEPHHDRLDVVMYNNNDILLSIIHIYIFSLR